ncbi:hypothetical protein Tco_1006958 [Tanacetum coccineum]|uniref:Uncharacterized protein n=1 Tax=Tanacetum coccineum TaxID=301880 RepID=A0ABQ5FJ85_9ASTR
MEEMLYKFIEEGKREQEEMRSFIHEFKTTNELLFKEMNSLLSELRFEVQGLLRVINNTPISNQEVKGVTSRGWKKQRLKDVHRYKRLRAVGKPLIWLGGDGAGGSYDGLYMYLVDLVGVIRRSKWIFGNDVSGVVVISTRNLHVESRIVVFTITLVGAAKRWMGRIPAGTVDTWDLLKRLSFSNIVHLRELRNKWRKFIILDKKEMRLYTRHGKDTMTSCTNANPGNDSHWGSCGNQEMVEHSHKWHDGELVEVLEEVFKME